MKLRRLNLSDAPRMLEWMKDINTTHFLTIDTSNATITSAQEFIRASLEDTGNLHFAVTDNQDQYLGTISLKNIDKKAKKAEYAICLHPDAIGQGVSHWATKAILQKAFHELNLHKVYLNVLSENERAVRFYEKFGFLFEGKFKKHVYINGHLCDLCWYAAFSPNEEDLNL